MRRGVPAAVVVIGLLGGVLGVGRRYRRDLAEATDRADRRPRRVIDTEFGAVEFAEEGSGPAVLVSHGIFHGFDGGLLSVRDVVADRRLIAPSRFGYLGSSLPPDATAATQADAFVALLDHLGLGTVDVVAVSAGTSAAIQLALRRPDRVDHLVISSGNFPGSTTSEAPPDWARLFYSDPAMWFLRTFARPAFSRLMGVPDGFPRTPAEERLVEEMLASIFPVGPRARGAIFDAYVSNPEVTTYPLEDIRVPTMLVHAEDDPLASFGAAIAAADRMPGSTLLRLESGGHLQLGQTELVRSAVSAFLDS